MEKPSLRLSSASERLKNLIQYLELEDKTPERDSVKSSRDRAEFDQRPSPIDLSASQTSFEHRHYSESLGNKDNAKSPGRVVDQVIEKLEKRSRKQQQNLNYEEKKKELQDFLHSKYNASNSKSAHPVFKLEPCKHLRKSKRDHLKYRSITLENGLQVVLAEDNSKHDEGERMSACSMAVNAGSFLDPKNVQGLAHFCEHMVFMGSKKYPGEGDWSNFISIHNGDENAFTEQEYTVYYFSISPAQFDEGLDRFAQFFIEPLFDKGSTEREIIAIDEEFEGVIQDDSCRNGAVLSHTCHPQSPLNGFSWGNKKSLVEDLKNTKIDLDKVVREYHKKFYVAENMKLYVFGQNLDDLEKYVRKSFHNIKSGKKLPLKDKYVGHDYKENINPLSPSFRKYTYIYSVTDEYELVLWWYLPRTVGDYKKKVLSYFENTIGHEGPTSLISHLREQGLATELCAGLDPDSGDQFNEFGLLNMVSVDLTEKGYQKKELVLEKMFEYLAMLRNAPIVKYIFDEFQQISHIKFQEKDMEDPIDVASEISQQMHLFDENDILCGKDVTFEYDESLIRKMLECMTPEKCRIDIRSRDDSIKYDKVEPWFNVKYCEIDIPEAQMKKWQEALPDLELCDFELPERNKYIPDDLQIKNQVDDRKRPNELNCEGFGRFFHLTDTRFSRPKTNVKFLLELPGALATLSDLCVAAILSDLFASLMEAFLYPSYLAGISTSIVTNRAGIFFKVEGFSHHLLDVVKDLLEQLVQKVQGKHFPQRRFEMQKEVRLRELQNTMFKLSEHHRVIYNCVFYEDQKFSIAEKIEQTKKLGYEKFCFKAKNLLDTVYIRCLIHGNCDEEEAEQFVNDTVGIFKDCNTENQAVLRRIIKLPRGSTAIVRNKVVNPAEKNCSVQMWHQIGPAKYRDAELLNDFLQHVIYEQFFDQLRTKEQLGYHVFTFTHNLRGILYFCAQVNSTNRNPEEVRQSMESFLGDQFPKFLESMSDKIFKSYVDSLIVEKKAPENNLSDVSHELWYEISNKTYVWNRKEKDIVRLKTLTKAELIKYYRKYISPAKNAPKNKRKSCRRFIHCIYGEGNIIPEIPKKETLEYLLFGNRMSENTSVLDSDDDEAMDRMSTSVHENRLDFCEFDIPEGMINRFKQSCLLWQQLECRFGDESNLTSSRNILDMDSIRSLPKIPRNFL